MASGGLGLAVVSWLVALSLSVTWAIVAPLIGFTLIAALAPIIVVIAVLIIALLVLIYAHARSSND